MARDREPPILVEATIIEVMSNRLFSARLPNGKRVAAHIPSRLATDSPPFAPGDRVVLELTPYDFSRARIRMSDHADSNPPTP